MTTAPGQRSPYTAMDTTFTFSIYSQLGQDAPHPTPLATWLGKKTNTVISIQKDVTQILFPIGRSIDRSYIHTPCRQEAPLPLLLAVVLLKSNRKTRLSRQWTGKTQTSTVSITCGPLLWDLCVTFTRKRMENVNWGLRFKLIRFASITFAQ